MRLAVLAAGAALLAQVALAQDLPLRHELIMQHHKAGDAREVIRLVEDQLLEVRGTPWQDSIHLYVEPYGVAMVKVKGGVQGGQAAEQLVELVKERGNPQHILSALLDLGMVHYEAGRLSDCIRVDSSAVLYAMRTPGFTPRQKGEALYYLCTDLSVGGYYPESVAAARRALEQFAMADSMPIKRWADTYNIQGASLWHQGRIHEAQDCYQRALEALEGNDGIEFRIAKGMTYGNLAILWQDAGDLVRSNRYYHETLRIFNDIITTSGDPQVHKRAIILRSRSYLNLATSYYAVGDNARSRELLELALADRERMLEPGSPLILGVKERMADLEISEGDLEKAERLVRDYQQACLMYYGKGSEEYARSTWKLGSIALEMGELQRADSLVTESMCALGPNNNGTNLRIAKSLTTRAKLRTKAGRPDLAQADLREATAMVTKVFGPQGWQVAGYKLLLAGNAYTLGNYRSAADLAGSALGMLEERRTYLEASNVPKAFPEPYLLSEAMYWKVRAEHDLGESHNDQWEKDLDLGIRSLLRNSSSLDDKESRVRLMGTEGNLFALAYELAFERYQGTPDPRAVERFISLSEAHRSVVLKARLNEIAAMQFAGVPEAVREREQELRVALAIDPDASQPMSDMDRKEQDYARFLAMLEKEYPRYFNLRYGERAINLEQIRQQLLEPGRQLLVYVRTPDRLYGVVVGRDTASITRLRPEGLAEAVQGLKQAILGRDRAGYVRQAYQVYRIAMEPLMDRLQGGELLIIPDGELHGVNFETLLSGPDEKDFQDRLLIHRFTIAYLFSATTALQFADITPGKATGTLAMAPGFAQENKDRYLAGLKDSTRADQQYLGLVRQPFAVRTARALGRLVNAEVVTDRDATEATFRLKAPHRAVLYLGTHALMNDKAPMHSMLMFSQQQGDAQGNDGYLYAYELYELELHTQLAVLAGCETGTGKQDSGEGIRSLAAAFAYSGCPSLVASMWKIDEKTTATIIEQFYDRLAEGMPKHKALREAKLQYLAMAKDELLLPYYWGGLVLTGNVDPVDLGRRGLPWWAIGGVVLGLALGGAAWARRRAKGRKAA